MPLMQYRARTSFCPSCGEIKPADRPITLAEVSKQFFQAFTSVDGRFIRSVRYLVARPGVLTTAYMQGRHVLYLGPVQLFLAANVLFFAVQSLTGTNIVSSPLHSHLHVQDWSSVAQGVVDRRLVEKNISLAAYAPLFDQAVIFYGKLLIALMVLPFTFLVYLSAIGQRRSFATHIVFSLHFYTFLLLLFCVSLVAAEVNVLFGGARIEFSRDGPVTDPVQSCGLYRVPVLRNRRRLRKTYFHAAAESPRVGMLRDGHSAGLSVPAFFDHFVCHVTQR